ncbi:hypothetical protein [Microbulbifer sp. JTAC008]|uniref:hypothetical protein n=1 Tax=unclassified Microbulbifer TaxID=2619833 RepID=UPI00403A151B
MGECDKKLPLDLEVPKEGMTLDLVLRPQEQKNNEPVYWPLHIEGTPGEEFGNMHFKIHRKAELILRVKLDLSDVPGRELEFVRYRQGHKLDGLIALTPDFRHQFRARAREVDGDYTQLIIRIKDRADIQDRFNFLWMCVDPETGMHFVSGDPQAVVDPFPASGGGNSNNDNNTGSDGST